MTYRPTIVRSIPFWVLLVVSAVLTGVGAWLVLDRLGRMESAIVNQAPEATIEVYVGAPTVTASAIVLGAGLVGLLLTLAVAVLGSLRAADSATVVEEIDWASDDESFPAPPAAASADAPSVTEPAAAPAPAAAASAPAAPAGHADPVIAEDPDVETPSDAGPPPAARD